jgi:hypothetical protein
MKLITGLNPYSNPDSNPDSNLDSNPDLKRFGSDPDPAITFGKNTG